jgi:AcrR family transcriptional regulator
MPGEALQPGDWARAAIEAIAERGVAAVTIEGLAADLGVSKGSFYWHFADRAALIEAALARWEEAGTEAGQRALDSVADPGERLRRLFAEAFGYPRAGQVEAALVADAGNPVVVAVLRRVTESRLSFTTQAFVELGFDRATARHRALVAYSAYLGSFAMRRSDPRAAPARRNLDAYLRELLAMLTARAPSARRARD